mgnify:CR=1 FL=1
MILKNSWSVNKARKYIKKYKNLGFSEDLALRVYTTRLLGRNKKLVLHGGGNTSVKTKIKDIDGKKYDVLCVKGSGWDMADIEPEGLPAVKLEPLLSLKNKKYLSDEDMVSYQKKNLINIKSPNPSVETFLHAFLPFKYVDHTHADAILNVTNRPRGLNFCKKIFGNKVSIVPYVMPGFKLSKKVSEIYSKNPKINCLILMNHGIFTFSNDAKEAYSLMIKYVSQAERAIKKLKVKKIKQIKNYSTKFSTHDIAPIIRGLSSNNNDQKFIVNYRLNKDLKYFMNGKNVRSYSSKGTATPDHVIRVKPFPLIITPKKNSSISDFKLTAKKAFDNYRKKYINYFNVNNKKVKGKKVMLDTSPRVVFVQNVGMFSIGKDLNAAKIAGDLTDTNAKVIASVEETSSYKFIPEKDLFDVEYWSLEQAKIKKQKKLLEGNIVVITGSTGAIGFATYKIFKSYGAEVILLDYNLDQLKNLQSKIKITLISFARVAASLIEARSRGPPRPNTSRLNARSMSGQTRSACRICSRTLDADKNHCTISKRPEIFTGSASGALKREANRRAPAPVSVRSIIPSKLISRPPSNAAVISRFLRVAASIAITAVAVCWRGGSKRGMRPFWVSAT